MGLSIALALFASAASGGAIPAPAHVPTSAVAPALATVRILSGAKIRLSAETQPEGYAMKRAQITVEDGTRRNAQLVEFE